LLPDGRVIAAGGEDRFPGAGDPDDPRTYEIYYPPYLFVSDGMGGYRVRDQSGDRPVITSISEHGPAGSKKVYYGGDFTIGVSDIDLDGDFAVALMRPCSVTHSNDMNQRLIYADATKLTSTSILVDGSSLDAELAPPGAYMVFVLDQSQASPTIFSDGIPSEAGWIFLEEGVAPANTITTWTTNQTLTADFEIAVGETLVINSGVTVNFDPGDANDIGVDSGRSEMIVRGELRLNGTSGSPIVFKRSGMSTAPASWYGVRVTETGRIVFQGESNAVTIKNARAAVAWERRDCPDFNDIDSLVTFTNVTDYITFDRDVVVGAGVIEAVPAGWRVGFEDGDAGGCGADPTRVEFVVMGQCDIGASTGGTTTLRPALGVTSWYGVRFLDSSDSTAISDLINVEFTGTVFTVTTDSLSGSITGCSFGDADSAEILIANDTRIPSGKVWSFAAADSDSAMTIRVASRDPRPAPRAGLDSAAVEVLFEGSLDADNGVTVTFRSPADSTGDWYGIRVGGPFDTTILSNPDDLVIKHACAPFILEAFDLDELQDYFDDSATYATVDSCLMDVGLGTDWVPDGTTASYVPDGWTIGMAPRYDRGEGGADTSRVEIDATGASSVFDFGEGTTLRSVRRAPGAGDWLGVRTPDTDLSNSVAGSGTPRFLFPGGDTDPVTIRDAGGAFSLEGDLAVSGWPDFDLMDSVVVFQNNRSHFSVDRDLVVTDRRTLPAGWTMGFTTRRDSSFSGANSALVELVVKGAGSLTAVATASDPIGFASDAGRPWPGDWHGLRLALVGVEMTGYGYLQCPDGGGDPDTCWSTVLKGVTISDARYGIAIDSLRAATIDSVAFTNIEDDRHIYLNGTDVVISRQLWWLGSEVDYWNLLPGTNVVASQTATDRLSYGESGKVDLPVWGKMYAEGTQADPVVFRSDSMSTATGDDWGGIILSAEAAGSLIKYADIGFAHVPVFLSYPDTLTAVSNSVIHHFNDTGIWVEGAKKQGGVIQDNVIQRDDPTTSSDDMQQSVGNVGIFLDRADEMNVVDNIVNLGGLETGSGGTGIDVYWGSSFCQSSPTGNESLLIQGNFVGGPGNTESGTDDYSGIRLTWVCGEVNRSIDILENYIEEWRYSGLEFAQSEDIQVSCNYVGEVLGGLNVYLTKTAGAMIRVKDNALEALESSDNHFAVTTNDTAAVGLGPAGSNVRGTNRLTVNDSQTWFVDHDSSGTFQAQDNFWYLKDNSTGAVTQVTSQQSDITNRIDGAAAIDNWGTTDPGDQDCPPARPAGAPAARAVSGPVTAQADDDRSRVQAAAPREISLGLPFPNPSRGGFEVALAVPPDRLGRYAMEVFDVTGRRVLRSDQRFTAPGRFSVVWGGRDQSGQGVASGIYFLRLTAPGFREVRKVTLVR
jgi:urease beta subunit